MTRYSISSKLSPIGLVEGFTVTGTLHNEENEVIKTVTLTGKVKSILIAEVNSQLLTD